MNTTENNKIIAEFMGFKLQDNPNERFYNKWLINSNAYGGRYNFEEFYFDVDWNWLVEVVEKIEATEVNNIKYIDFHIMPDAVIVRNQEDENNPLILINKSEGKGSIEKDFIMFETKIQAVYDACVKFIKWYNEQNK